MNPFWAVRRMSPTQMAEKAAKTAATKLKPRFNCALVTEAFTAVTVGVVKSVAVNTTRIYQIPFLTNITDLEEGEELIMEVNEKKAKETDTKRTWVHAFRDEEKKKKQDEARAQKTKAQKAAKDQHD